MTGHDLQYRRDAGRKTMTIKFAKSIVALASARKLPMSGPTKSRAKNDLGMRSALFAELQRYLEGRIPDSYRRKPRHLCNLLQA